MYSNESGRLIQRARITEWVTIYEDKDGNQVKVRGFKKPTKHRIFRVSAKPGRRKFKAVRVSKRTKEVIVVAKTKKGSKKSKKKEEVDEELEGLEDLEDLDDLDDEDVEDDEDVDADEDADDDDDADDEDDDDDDDEDDDDEDDEEDDEDDEDEVEEEPKKKKGKSKKGKGKSRAKGNGKVGTQEVAEFCGIDGRTLRMVLRKHKFPKDEETGRYEWSSLKHPDVKKLAKLIKEKGEAKNVKKESLENLKSRKTKKSKTKAKSSKSKSKKKKSEDDDE